MATSDLALGEKMRAMRTERNWTLDELSDQIAAGGFKLSGSAISRLERGKWQPSVPTLQAFAFAFDVEFHISQTEVAIVGDG